MKTIGLRIPSPTITVSSTAKNRGIPYDLRSLSIGILITDRKNAKTIGTTKSEANFTPPMTTTTQLKANKKLNPLFTGNFNSGDT